jgi:hypothetical protein
LTARQNKAKIGHFGVTQNAWQGSTSTFELAGRDLDLQSAGMHAFDDTPGPVAETVHRIHVPHEYHRGANLERQPGGWRLQPETFLTRT